jgi:hypothetical protein
MRSAQKEGDAVRPVGAPGVERRLPDRDLAIAAVTSDRSWCVTLPKLLSCFIRPRGTSGRILARF